MTAHAHKKKQRPVPLNAAADLKQLRKGASPTRADKNAKRAAKRKEQRAFEQWSEKRKQAGKQQEDTLTPVPPELAQTAIATVLPPDEALELHPDYANYFAPASNDEIARIEASMERGAGPTFITTLDHEGEPKILDGRARYDIAKRKRLPLLVTRFEDLGWKGDVLDYLFAMNEARRQTTSHQRAAACAHEATLRQGRPKTKADANGYAPLTIPELAAKRNTNERAIQRVLSVQRLASEVAVKKAPPKTPPAELKAMQRNAADDARLRVQEGENPYQLEKQLKRDLGDPEDNKDHAVKAAADLVAAALAVGRMLKRQVTVEMISKRKRKMFAAASLDQQMKTIQAERNTRALFDENEPDKVLAEYRRALEDDIAQYEKIIALNTKKEKAKAATAKAKTKKAMSHG
jgi:hypothetical protein